jgi:hypothetical protein
VAFIVGSTGDEGRTVGPGNALRTKCAVAISAPVLPAHAGLCVAVLDEVDGDAHRGVLLRLTAAA